MGVLSTHIYVPLACSAQRQKRVLCLLELKWQGMVGSHCVGARNQTQVLYKSSKCP